MIRGLVLAGGKSSRFGEDKALAHYEGISFLERAVNSLKLLGLHPVVVTRRGADYSFVRCPVIYDKFPEQGPLGGIYTALTVFRETAFLTLTCDMPFVTLAALSGLLEEKESREITIYSVNDKIEKFPGVYGPSALRLVRRQLLRNELSMRALLDASSEKKIIAWPGDPSEFSNVNRKEDLVLRR